jgi:hypothetical protein
VFRVALAKFHREILQLATRSIDTVPREQREIQGHTCSLSAENFFKAKVIVEEAMQKLRDLGNLEAQGGSVFHMEVALIPLTCQKASAK